jgi:hypothetical protein
MVVSALIESGIAFACARSTRLPNKIHHSQYKHQYQLFLPYRFEFGVCIRALCACRHNLESFGEECGDLCDVRQLKASVQGKTKIEIKLTQKKVEYLVQNIGRSRYIVRIQRKKHRKKWSVIHKHEGRRNTSK